MTRNELYNYMARTPDRYFTVSDLEKELAVLSDDSIRRMCRDLVALDRLEPGPLRETTPRKAETWRIKGVPCPYPVVSVQKIPKRPSVMRVKIPRGEHSAHRRGRQTQHLLEFLHAAAVQVVRV